MSVTHTLTRSDAYVTCRDGKIRRFIATSDDEVMHYKGKKYIYLLWNEPEGRGFIVMYAIRQNHKKYLLAPNHMQPVLIEAKTWAGRWNWKSLEV